MKILSAYKNLLKRNRWWIFFIVALAAVWTIIGYVIAVSFPDSVAAFTESLGEVFDEALQGVEPQASWQFALALFQQNGIAAGMNLLFGILFGIVPIFGIIVNFFTLGFLAGPAFNTLPGINSIGPGLFLAAIAPHGIFELPALLLAAAFGFRLGWHWLLPASAGWRRQIFKESFRDALIALPLIAILLVIAALIESFVTFNLVN